VVYDVAALLLAAVCFAACYAILWVLEKI